MSKYIYATVYEQFTGLKPPEPKSHKPRRRRGYGHPYRMRLNMQEGEEQSPENLENNDGDDILTEQEAQPVNMPSLMPIKTQNPSSYTQKTTPYTPITTPTPRINYNAEPEYRPDSKQPKVTYKKRRHFDFASPAETSENAGFI